MKRLDDREGSESKRGSGEENGKREQPNYQPHPKQAPETLRPGFSWVQFMKNQHPGWDFVSVDGYPWTPLAKPLVEARVALITTTGVYLDGQKPFTTGPGSVSDVLRRQKFRGRGDVTFREIPRDALAEDFRVSHAYYDHTDAEEDINCIFPLDRLAELESENFIGEAAPKHYSLMGYVPEPHLLGETQREMVARLKAAQVDAVLLTAGDPLSHQTATLLQREVEQAGIPTVAITVCRDITQLLNAPRAVALRFPLGNPFGHPFDEIMQFRIIKNALQALETFEEPGVIQDLAYDWVEEEE